VQAFTFGFAELYNENATIEPPNPYEVPYPTAFSFDNFPWYQIWTYRRLYSPEHSSYPEPGDITLQNWGPLGNDFPFGYLFLSKNDTAAQVVAGNWTGGISIPNLDAAARQAWGWHYWYKEAVYKNESSMTNKITFSNYTFGTCHHLSKLPYMRESRRSIGLNSFVMTISNISGLPENLTGFIYPDRIGTGCYDVDIHEVYGCDYPPYMKQYYPVLPYFIPLRALTNMQYENLLVAGKTMAQSFLTNAATRLHPVEWNSGLGAGVVASYMVLNGLTTTQQAYEAVTEIQAIVAKYQPLSWTINGTLHPPN